MGWRLEPSTPLLAVTDSPPLPIAPLATWKWVLSALFSLTSKSQTEEKLFRLKFPQNWEM